MLCDAATFGSTLEKSTSHTRTYYGGLNQQRPKSRPYHEGSQAQVWRPNFVSVRTGGRRPVSQPEHRPQGPHRHQEGRPQAGGGYHPSQIDDWWSNDCNSRVEHPQATYDKASQDLYTILYLVTDKPAQLMVLKHGAVTGISDNGQQALRLWGRPGQACTTSGDRHHDRAESRPRATIRRGRESKRPADVSRVS